MKGLKPKCGSGNVLEGTPKHLPDDIENFCLSDIIAGPLTVIPKGSQKFEVPNYEKAVKFFNQASKVDRKAF